MIKTGLQFAWVGFGFRKQFMAPFVLDIEGHCSIIRGNMSLEEILWGWRIKITYDPGQ